MRFFKKRTLNTPAIVKEEKKDKNLVDSKKVVEEYLNQSNWRVKENANMSYAVQGLNNFIASKVSAKYWLSLYPEEISTAHREGDLHLHDLAMLGNYCFSGNTKVKLLDGTTPTLKELSKRKGEFWVYSINSKGEIVPGKARNARLTRRGEETLTVKLDNKKSIVCTKDHKFMLRDGTYKEAKDLKVGESLMPLYFSKKGNGYECIWNLKGKNTDGNKVYTHRHIMNAQPGQIVHHKNGNKKDNRPENLEVMDDKEHRSMEMSKTMSREDVAKQSRKRLSILNKMSWRKKQVKEMAQKRRRDTKGRFLNGNNHKVVSISLNKKKEDVYCMTVDKYKNFALEAGVFVHNCCGWDLKDLLIRGFGGVSEKPQSAPPKHLRSALGQIVNFLYTLQGEANGAQAVASFDTFLAPFVRYDGLDYKGVKQAIQEFVFNMNVPTRVGFQTVFSNITLDVTPSSEIAEQNIIIGGEIKNEKYGDFQKEMDMINKAFGQVMLEGDSTGKPFSFPIPTYNVDKDFPWDKECLEPIFKATAKYGIPYFANFVSTGRSKDETRSMCCFSGNTKTVVNVRGDEIQITLEKLSRRISPFKIWNGVEWKDAKSVVVDYNDRLLDVKCENGFVYSMTKNHLNYVKESNGEKIVVATDLKEGDELPYYTGNEIVYSKIASISEGEFASKAYCVEVQGDNPKFMLFGGLLTHNCRLSLDLTEIKKRGGGLFGADALTGSIGVVTINMARLGYIAKNEEDYINKLYRLMDLAKDSLEIKRDLLEKYMEGGLYPYSKHYLDGTKRRFGKYWANHFSTIGINGMNESLINFFGKDIASEEGIEFTTKIMNLMNDRLRMYQEETGNLYNLEASPAEGAGYRFALSDKEKYPKIICANEPAYRKGAKPFYTNCVSDDTECLTINGWKRYEDIKVGDDILTLNMDSNSLEYKPVLHINKQHISEGEMYSIKSKRQDQLVTPNHKVLIDGSRKGFYRLSVPSKLPSSFVVPMGGRYNSKTKVKFRDDFIRLVGWIITEGHFERDNQGIRITQAEWYNKKKFDEIEGILKRLDIKYSIHGDSRGRSIFRIPAKEGREIRQIISSKNIPRWCLNELPLRQMSILIKEMMKGDGSISKHSSYYSTGDIKLANEFQELCLKAGRRAIICDCKEKTGSYHITPSEYMHTEISSSNISKVKYSGVVWCPTTENGTWVARRNNKPFITGNSTHVPVDYTDDLFTLLDKQNDIQSLYSGGTVVHAFLGEKVDDIDNVKKLIKTIFSRYKLPYLSITPTFSICQKHGYLPGEQHYCPKCEAEDK